VQVRDRPCDCEWPHQCDSQLQQLPPTRNLLAVQAAAATAGLAAQPASESSQAQPSGAAAGSQPAGPRADSQHGALPQPGSAHSLQQGANSEAERPASVQAAADGRSMAAHAWTDLDQSDSEAACQRLEDRFVNDVYNEIAPHFHSTR
jgi:membrane protein involved in colicin uptake